MSQQPHGRVPWQGYPYSYPQSQEYSGLQHHTNQYQTPQAMASAQYQMQGVQLSASAQQQQYGYARNPGPAPGASFQPASSLGDFSPSHTLVYPYQAQASSGHCPTEYMVPAAGPSQYISVPGATGQYPSSGDNSDFGSQEGGSQEGGNEITSLSARHHAVQAWIARTNLTPDQIKIANSIISSTWWANEDPEPEVYHGDELAQRGLIPVGGSRFRAFLDELNGYKCTFTHDGQLCNHGKGRPERALGTIRRFFRYKPVSCNNGCGSPCNLRFVSVEQCQKHIQKKRAGRAQCTECGSLILTQNMGRHRRSCHA